MIKSLALCALVSASAVACSTTDLSKSAPPKTAAVATRPCPQDSSSRIPLRPGECSPVPGRTYSDKDMERTGQTDVGNALQMLDPSITVHH
jgi:hypothetical protein